MKHLLFTLMMSATLSRAALAAGTSVDIHEYQYVPAAVTIHAGDSVTWINRDQVPHTIVEKDKNFRSSALDTGDKFTHAFTTPGTYTYFCTLHPQMIGTVTVVK